MSTRQNQRAQQNQRAAKRSLTAIFAIPAAIAAFSLFGLISALTGDGLRDILSWLGLGIPVVIASWAWWRREKNIQE